MTATVQARGTDGTLAVLFPMDSDDHIDHVWLTDGTTGEVIGTHSFVAPRNVDTPHAPADRIDTATFVNRSLEPVATFEVRADDIAALQAHTYSARSGLRSGPVIDTAMATSAAAIKQ